jgi:formylglycine-generating enzyme required for sulfatase activity
MRLMPAGTFDMGCTEELLAEGHCDTNELDVHEVTITRDFWIAETEMTQDESLRLDGTNVSAFVDCGGDCPLESVSWHDAAERTNALSGAESLPSCYTCGAGTCEPVADIVGCGGYRLPTEAEWEYAARCDDDFVFAGSDVAAEVAWYSTNAESTTHPVHSKAANGCGLYGLSGNVWEWVNDAYEVAYGSEPEVDPAGPAESGTRIKRGGSWVSVRQLVRVSNRSYDTPPEETRPSLGFRPVRTFLGPAAE